MKYRIFEVLIPDIGVRIDKWIANKWAFFPYSGIQRSIRKGDIRVNDKKINLTSQIIYCPPLFKPSQTVRINRKMTKLLPTIITYDN